MRAIGGLWPFVCIGLITLSVQTRAYAQAAPPAPTASGAAATAPASATAQSTDAKAIYDHALSLYALGRYAEAAPLFERAFELKPIPALLYNAAQAHRFAGHAERAVTLYESYLRMFGDPARKAEIEAHIAELKAAIAAQRHAATSPPTAADQAAVGATAPPPLPPPPSAPPSAATPSSETLTATAPERPKPIYKKAWFWAAVGGGAVVIAGIAVGIAVGTRGHTSPTASFGTVDGN